jgi:hypothetical protein
LASGDVVVPADTGSATSLAGSTINLTAETHDIKGTFAGYSVNAGKKWVVATALPTGADFSKLLDKGMDLWLATEMSGNKASGTSIAKFPKIAARPKAPKFKPWYTDAGVYTLGDGKAAATLSSLANLLIADADDGGKGKKLPDSPTWVSFGEVRGTPEFDNEAGKAVKETKFLRSVATVSSDGKTFTPNSRTGKFSVSSNLRAPRAKANYKNETIKLKVGDWYEVVGVKASVSSKAAAVIEIKDVLNDFGTVEFIVERGATGKKPASQPFFLVLAQRGAEPTTLTFADGKFDKDFAKLHEVKSGTKWSGLKTPKATVNSMEVRRKAGKIKNEKNGTLEDATVRAASGSNFFAVIVGKLDPTDDKSKSGITTVNATASSV